MSISSGYWIGDTWVAYPTNGDDEAFESHCDRMIEAAEKMIDSGKLKGWEFDGRTVSNIEMYALSAAAQYGPRAIMQRFCDRLIAWIQQKGGTENDAHSTGDVQPSER